jgi:endo-1,3-1,4-beta-glycanase ExoK
MKTAIFSRPWLWFCLPAIAAVGCASAPPSDDGGARPAGDALVGPGGFTLAWEDNFDSFDSKRWSLQTHSWNGNLAQFSVDNTRFQDGIASILLTRAESDTDKPFRGVEMRSKSTITYGKVETRARFAKGSGVISAVVLIYTPWPADDWNELDMEYLAGRSGMQFNTMVYDGPPVSKPVTTSVTPTQAPRVVDLGFDATADFHVYTMEWTPSAARFLVDGAVKHEWDQEISLMRLPQNLLLTIWASSSAAWAGAVGDDTAPTQADFDWVRVYDWGP